MKAIIACLVFGFSVLAHAQEPIRLKIRHADPWFVKAMLEGTPVMSPELSLVALASGNTAAIGMAAAQNRIQNGFLIVDPADNSLWFVPNRS
jgi:hypothetical protein